MPVAEVAHRLDVTVDDTEAVHVLEPERELIDPVISESGIERLLDVRRERSMLAELH